MAAGLSIIIVNWNVRDLLAACLDSIASSPGVQRAGDDLLMLADAPLQVLVVDNASTDGSVDAVRAGYPWVELVESGENLGFTGGNNLALPRCTGRYILLLNPDTRLVGDALRSMVAYMDEHPDVGVLGPRLCYGDGSPQASARRFPTLMTGIMESTLLEQWFPGNRWARWYRMTDTSPDETHLADWVVGACLLARAAAVAQVGPLDEAYFMYSEELDWCRRIVSAGWKVVYYADALVIHYEGRSSEQVVARRHILFESSKIRYYRKHVGRSQAEVLHAVLMLTYIIRIVTEAAKLAVGHKPDLRRARIAAYRQVLASRLRGLEASAR